MFEDCVHWDTLTDLWDKIFLISIGVAILMGGVLYLAYKFHFGKVVKNIVLGLLIIAAIPAVVYFFIFICVYPIPMLSAPFVGYYVMYCLCSVLFWLNMVSIVFFLGSMLIKYRFTKFYTIPSIRGTIIMVYKYIPSLFLISFICLTLEILKRDMPDYYGYCCAFSVLYSVLFWVWINSKEQFGFLYPFRNYAFFLRSFNDDENINVDRALLRYYDKKHIIEIGDPTTVEGNTKFVGTTLFLPTKDWKKEVLYYIHHARSVLCTLHSTPGVFWELSNYSKYPNKFIFHVKLSDIPTILESWKLYSDKSNQVIEALCALKGMFSVDQNKSITFTIHDNVCYYSSSIYSLLDYVIKKEYNSVVQSFYLLNLDSEEETQKKRIQIGYLFKDLLRFQIRLTGLDTQKKILIIIGFILYFILFISSVIASLASILLGLLGLLGLFINPIADLIYDGTFYSTDIYSYKNYLKIIFCFILAIFFIKAVKGFKN